ncbi:MAG TPA: LPXTG cell wall anchor domain-containing protein [Acidimicrobiia bacterium]|nr:LPXTG cell wall anchor domain-containing protein [Acidimicrobiia bacterium]
MWGRVVAGTVLAAAVLLGSASGALAQGRVPQTPGPEPGSPEQMEYFADQCRHELQRPPTAAPGVGRVENVTSPGPGTAMAGDVIDISLSWDPADFDDTWIQKVLNCVSIDGTPVPELTDEERPAPNDGTYGRELVVPADIEDGHLLCQQGFVYGNLSRGGYSLISSPRVCFTTQAAPPPPPPPTPTTEPPTTTTTEAPTTTTTAPPAPARVAAGEPAPLPAPAPKKELPKTGPHDRPLLLGAGAALAMGGLALAAGARRRQAGLS